MPYFDEPQAADVQKRRQLFVFNGGFLRQKRIKRILQLSGYDIKLGKPCADDLIGVWGQSPTSGRGAAMAKRTGAQILRVEDAFLRSIQTGRSGEMPLGLCLDQRGVHFDPAYPSDLETLLTEHPLDNTVLLNRAKTAIERIKAAHLSKYNAYDPATPLPDPGYVLVIDQTKDDASVTASGADLGTFREMLVFAQEEHPGARVLIKTHPETVAGHREGYYGPNDIRKNVSLFSDPVSPWGLMDGAIAVYTVSSQLGFEAIFAGHRPRVFGQPFYGGWGLTQDQNPLIRRQRSLTRAQIFAAAMILYPKWYDPYRDQLCELENVIDTLEAQTRSWRADHRGYVASAMRLWKRAPLQVFYGQHGKLRFQNDLKRARKSIAKTGAAHLVWASGETADMAGHNLLRVEDGFLRSKGLGATLCAPLSLVADDLGIYYDPNRPSRLEHLINASPNLPDYCLQRAERLISCVVETGLSKYNIGKTDLPDLPKGMRILVAGQVEGDASIIKGCDAVRRNIDLLRHARKENADAVIIYKPHPDVETGLLGGMILADEAMQYADIVLPNADPATLIDAVDQVWTMTSLLGFEALLRGREVTCLGMPFYAGWGLTHDLAKAPDRRTSRPNLAQLAHAVLIDYPRYIDPVTRLACPPEVVAKRLKNSDLPRERASLRTLASLQGLLANYTYLWR